jgi:hypothetical protein
LDFAAGDQQLVDCNDELMIAAWISSCNAWSMHHCMMVAWWMTCMLAAAMAAREQAKLHP